MARPKKLWISVNVFRSDQSQMAWTLAGSTCTHDHPQCTQDTRLTLFQMKNSLNWHTTGATKECCEPIECSTSDLPIFSENEDVIQIYDQKRIGEWSQNIVHQSPESFRSIS